MLEEGAAASGTGTGYAAGQFGYGSEFKNQWALHRKHWDANCQCPPTDNSGFVQATPCPPGGPRGWSEHASPKRVAIPTPF